MTSEQEITFIESCKQVRKEFVNTINNQEWNNGLRTKSETLLIMFDQFEDQLKREVEKALQERLPSEEEIIGSIEQYLYGNITIEQVVKEILTPNKSQ